MEKERAEYEHSLSAWRGQPRAAVTENREHTVHKALPYVPRYAHRDSRTLSNSQPLIDQVTNKWRESEKAPTDAPANESEDSGICDFEDEGSCPNFSRRAIRSRRFRRMLAAFVLLAVLLYYAWKWYLQPHFQEEWDFREGFLPDETNGTYGFARGGDFEGTFIKDINENLVPGGHADPEGKRRLVFVGDIHGCKHELTRLLEKIEFNQQTDHLIATGDVLSKGPDSPGVLDKLIRLGAESVRGNHEDRLLEAAKTLLGTNLPPGRPAATSQGYSKDHALLKHLKHKHIKYLRDMPLMLRIPSLPHASSKRKDDERIAEDIVVVHAGLVPHVPFLRQDPYFVMNMRSIDHRTHVPSALRETKKGRSKPWYNIWNWYNDRLARGRSIKGFHVYDYADWLSQQVPEGWVKGTWEAWARKGGNVKSRPQVVVYGHDSKSGLQMHRWSKGLDSGCVSGGKLTAMVLDAKGRTEIVQVGCKNYR